MQKQKPQLSVEFAGQVAVVTGAAQGIGRAIAEELQRRGARLILVDRNREGVAAAAESMRASQGSQVDSLVANLAEPAEIDALAARVQGLARQVDVLVNNAGIELD